MCSGVSLTLAVLTLYVPLSGDKRRPEIRSTLHRTRTSLALAVLADADGSCGCVVWEEGPTGFGG